MPTLLFKNGFQFFFYVNEHEPKHIHVVKGGNFAKIELGSRRVVKNTFKHQQPKEVLSLVAQYEEEFERKWNKYFRR